ncbi:conserved hypothetical protein (DUF3108) [Formosa agariphila KMM 3901]|uniref:DUF3108 domain-containing protein n=1 Tax=Formosa agariphila (strain DSM 15362 / KCTC 12365 / LMG 23005 / KMM 3901 / M-2Alg 35-1) TaxID=1347342 RepID=T2KPU2_FORAG|nr:conserved hypothetical protein (DUF3108) [Formosa agariphila KMM 3901]
MFIVVLVSCFSALGQSCSDYYPMEKGVSFELTHFNDKGKEDAVRRNTIIEDSIGVAVINTVVTDVNGKETINAEYKITCDTENVTIDINEVLSETLKSALSESDKEVTALVIGGNLIVPNDLKQEQILPNSDIEMDVEVGDLKLKFRVKTTDRKVVGEERISVPAGNFDCIVISQKVETKMMMTKRGESKIWLAQGVGVVKQEDYDEQGKVIASEKLTKFSK